MTTIDPALPLPEEPEENAAALPVNSAWDRWAARIERAGEYLNPILVKECRQALKSKQFGVTFGMLLICGWLWSTVGLAMQGTDVRYRVVGPEMFFGYYLILAFPLFVVIPYGAFRSLANEYEDRTYELLSITTLRPRQIIGGKLASAVMQMLVYGSALTPCLAFTYMLRGIDVFSVLLVLVYTFAASLAFSLIGLFLATVTKEKHWQVVLSVVLILGLAYGYIMACVVAMELLRMGVSAGNQSEFWIANAAFATAYLSYFALLFTAATARVTFSSDNRSTPQRVVMFIQQALLTGWIAWAAWSGAESPYAVYYAWLSYFWLLISNWYVMGALMAGESPVLSERVKRQLPTSVLGRMFLTWFFPGPATGFVFAVVNVLAGAAILVICVSLGDISIWNTNASLSYSQPHAGNLIWLVLFGSAYVIAYLGAGAWILWLARRFTPAARLTIPVHFFLILAGCTAPMVICTLLNIPTYNYSTLHLSNPFWTLSEVVRSGSPLTNKFGLFILLAGAAGFMGLLNLPGIAAELRHVRVARPLRVEEEDAETAPAKSSAEPERKSPWD